MIGGSAHTAGSLVLASRREQRGQPAFAGLWLPRIWGLLVILQEGGRHRSHVVPNSTLGPQATGRHSWHGSHPPQWGSRSQSWAPPARGCHQVRPVDLAAIRGPWAGSGLLGSCPLGGSLPESQGVQSEQLSASQGRRRASPDSEAGRSQSVSPRLPLSPQPSTAPSLHSSPRKGWGDPSLQVSGLVGVSTSILPPLTQGCSNLLLRPCLYLPIITERGFQPEGPGKESQVRMGGPGEGR